MRGCDSAAPQQSRFPNAILHTSAELILQGVGLPFQGGPALPPLRASLPGRCATGKALPRDYDQIWHDLGPLASHLRLDAFDCKLQQ